MSPRCRDAARVLLTTHWLAVAGLAIATLEVAPYELALTGERATLIIEEALR